MIDLGSLRLGFAFGAGTATFFAPCALPLLPGYVAFFLGDQNTDRSRPISGRLRRAAVVSLFVSLGFFLVFAALFGVAVAVGSRVLGNVALLELVVAPVLVVLGVSMIVDASWLPSVHVSLPARQRGPAGYLAFGILYAVAAAGCTGPLFVAIASFGLTASPVTALGMLAAYAAGMSVLLGVVTVVAALGRDTIVRTLATNSETMTTLAGVALVGAGVVQLYWFLFVFEGTTLVEEAVAGLV